MGKSSTFAVASAAPTPAAAAATRQSAWCRVTPRIAYDRRQLPARIPSAAPSGARRRPLNSRLAGCSSPGRRPRHLLDRDRAGPRLRAGAPEPCDTSRGGPAAKRIDEHGRVQQQAGHRQPERRSSPRLCRRTHVAGSSSHSCPRSGTLPSADSMSSQRRSSSRPCLISSVTKALRRRAPARRSSSATKSSSNAICMRMGQS